MQAFLHAIFLMVLVASGLTGCSSGRANSRIAYWKEETRLHVPVGTPLVEAKSFLLDRGLKLTCCMSGPDIENAHSAMERGIGRSGLIEYSALIVVDVSPDQRVSRVRVLRMGAGL